MERANQFFRYALLLMIGLMMYQDFFQVATIHPPPQFQTAVATDRCWQRPSASFDSLPSPIGPYQRENDRYIRKVCREIQLFFHIDLVAFDYYQESSCRSPNAFFQPPYFIFLGECMFHYVLLKFGREVISGVLAHEYVHILQHQRKWNGYLGPRDKELEADYLAGYYLTWRFKNDPAVRNAFAECAAKAGDYEWFNCHHHGFPEMRRSAVHAGIQAALRAIEATASGKPSPGLDQLHQQYLQFCYQLPEPACKY